jgi:chemotaxis protein methyltransferase CheR
VGAAKSNLERLVNEADVLSPEDARLFQELAESRCGIMLGANSVYFLARRILPRVEQLGLAGAREYYHYLLYSAEGPQELEDFIERITTHETYFFREQYQLDALCETILPEVLKGSRKRQITVWSAGCSTGEEAYTLAMLLLEHPLLREHHIRILGTDISRGVLSRARAGIYGQSSFRVAPKWAVEKYFDLQPNGHYRVRDEVRKLCSFGQLNLMSTDRYRVFSPCEVILCRNVIMYLNQPARLKVVEGFYNALSQGGYLLLGHSESLLNLSTRFDLVHAERDLVYRKGGR